MRFEKLSNDKIRIILDLQDLEDNDIDYQSFMSNSSDSQKLFMEILDEAEEQIGFITKDYKLMIEALATIDGDFIITVTRSLPDFDIASVYKKRTIKAKRKSNKLTTDTIIYEFNNFDDIFDFVLLLKNLKPLRSKKNVFYSLSSRMMFSFLCATLLVLTSFSFLYLNRSAVFEFLMDTFYQSEDYSSYVKKLEKQLQNFDLTKENKKVINHILKENALNHAYVELYDQDGIYFTDKSPLSSNNLLLLYSFDDLDVLEAPLYYDYPIHFKNQSVYLYITSFPMIPFQIPYIILSLLISFSFYLIILQSFIRKRIQSIQNLQEDVFTLAIGDWNHEIKVSDKDEIGRLAQDLNQMRIAFLQTMDNEQQARVANKELISSLSHDLRTPLTTLKGYLEIMNLKKDDIKFRDQYLQKCLDKVEEITYLSNKMFEYSLVFSTEYNSDLSNIPVQKLIDTLVDHIQYLREMDLHILYEPLQTSLSMDANFAIIQRILNNVFSNIQKYCDPWKDIVIQTTIEEDQLKMSFTNSINHHLDKVESNGIGLKSVKKMIKIHHGTFYQDETNDLFTIILTFPIHQ